MQVMIVDTDDFSVNLYALHMSWAGSHTIIESFPGVELYIICQPNLTGSGPKPNQHSLCLYS